MKKLNDCDTKYNGRFDIFIDNNIIYKKTKNNKLGNIIINQLKDINIFKKYKKIIEESYKNKYYGKYTIEGFDVEKDGSYKCKYIEGYRLDKIDKNILNIDKSILNKIKIQINKLKNDLNKFKLNLQGDWAIHNLVYNIKDDRIYNIDLEGFYSYNKLPKWGNINKINYWLNNLIIIIDKKLKHKNIVTHQDCYTHILNIMNKNNIEFVILRGFNYLPNKADTDLDIVIHPKSYKKFVKIYNDLKKDNLIRINKPKKYISSSKNNQIYISLFTAKHLKNSEHLSGKYYRFDIYSDLFFYKNGSTKYALTINSLFKKYLFDNKIKINNYYIPNPISEIILLIYRTMHDKMGKWNKKHINRIKELIVKVNKQEFNKISYMFYNHNIDLYKILKSNKFNTIPKPNQKLNLFIIRKKGMKKDIINNILNKIKKEYIIIDKIFININDKKKFYKKFYDNYINYEKDILNTNNNQCLAIITNSPINKNPIELKKKIRKEYIHFFPPIGNIIHCSDSSEDCEKELELLLDEKLNTFKNIGTYYTKIDV